MTVIPPARARSVSRAWIQAHAGDLLLLSVAAITATCSFNTTARAYNIIAIIAGVLAVLAVLGCAECRTVRPPAPLSMVLAALASLVPQLIRPPSGNVQLNHLLFPITVGCGALATGCLVGYLLLRPARDWLLYLGGVLIAVATLLTVPAGRFPRIDVWLIFQQASAGWLHGVNPYNQSFAGIPAGQTGDCFNYLPVSFMASWPGWLAFDDVRYAEVAIMLAGWASFGVTIWRRGSAGPTLAGLGQQLRTGRGQALALALSAAITAGTLRVAQQAWNESLALGFLLIAVSLIASGRAGWACLPIALALATKQHLALFVPLLIALPAFGLRRTVGSVLGSLAVASPWLIWNFGRFKACTVDFFLDTRARSQSISIWRALPSGLGSVVVIALVLLMLALAITRLPRTPGGFLLGCGAVLTGFNLANKQTFENQWWFAAELVICGLALIAVESGSQPDAEDGTTERDRVAAGPD